MASRADTGGTAGGFTALFVRRPILAVVLNSLIVIAGLAALLGIEVRELPDVDRPVITVTTDYDGAAPETVDRELTGVIEGAMGRISGVSAISSRSSFGRSRVTVEFTDATDLNVAASDARDSIGRILNQLPDNADEPRIVKADANAEAVIRIGVTSETMSVEDLSDLVENTVSDRLIAAPGVADVQLFGARDRIFRVDVDQTALASRGLTLADVRDTLATVAFDSPAGSLTATNQSLVVRTTATVNTPEAFGALMLDDDTRLSDVATVTLGPDSGDSILRSNGESGLGIGVIRQAESNTLEISRSIRSIVAELAGTLPEGVSIFVTGDDAVFINGSIHEVMRTLALSVIIVVAIIYLFLRDLRATLIPSLTIPVALIGALAAIYVVGFSVNILTLLALVLSTGLVVDDAIVVLENIVRRRAQGMGPRAAAVLGTQQVFFAVVASTTTLAAVFVPLSFLPGQAGALFREFGIALAMAVGDLGGGGAVALPDDGLADAAGRRGRGRAPRPAGQDRRRARGRLSPRAPRRARRAHGGAGARGHPRRDGVPDVLQHPAGGDPARGPLGGAAPGERAAGGEPRLHRQQAPRDRGAHGGRARLGRGGGALLHRRDRAATTAAS